MNLKQFIVKYIQGVLINIFLDIPVDSDSEHRDKHREMFYS